MSRHKIPARNRNLSVVVGWDIPLQTFFAQVAQLEAADDDKGDNHMLLWVGTEPREVITVGDLGKHLAPFADIPDQTSVQLRADRAAKLDQAPTPIQQELHAFIRRSR